MFSQGAFGCCGREMEGWSLRAEGNLRLIVKEEPQSTEGMGRGG